MYKYITYQALKTMIAQNWWSASAAQGASPLQGGSPILYSLFSGLAMLYIYIICIYIYIYISIGCYISIGWYISIGCYISIGWYISIFKSMSRSLSFAEQKILTKALLVLRPMVTSYGILHFCYIYCSSNCIRLLGESLGLSEALGWSMALGGQ